MTADLVRAESYIYGPSDAKWAAGAMGIRVRTLAGGEETGGALTVFDYEAPPGFPGPALHLHHAEDEAFFVTTGTLTVQAGGNRSEVSSGGFIWAPRGVAHGFCNASDEPVRFLVLVVPGNLEQMMREITSYFAEAAPAINPARIIDINQAHGLEVVGPPILNAPVPGG